MTIEGGNQPALPPVDPGLPLVDGPHRYPRATSARVLAAAFNVAVGLRLLWPDNVLDTVPSYRLAAVHFIGDPWMGLACLLYGTVMAVALFTDRWPRVAQSVTFLSLLTWLLFAIDLAIVNPSQLGTLAYVLIAALHGFALAHLLFWQQQLERDARDAL